MPRTHYSDPAWTEDGMDAWIRWDQAKGTALKCKVACAAGDHARVVNKAHGVDKWLPLDQLLVPPGDPREWPSVKEADARQALREAEADVDHVHDL